MVEAWRLREFGFSRQDFLPGFRQLESYQTSADEGGEGQEDGDDLSDADEGCKYEAGKDGSKLTDPIQDPERCPSAEAQRQRDYGTEGGTGYDLTVKAFLGESELLSDT